MNTARIFAICALWAVVTAPALGSNLLFLQDAPVAYFTEEDDRMFQAALKGALDTAKDGEAKSWSNPASGASGTLTVLKTHNQHAMTCRTLKIFSTAKSRTGESVWDFCKQPDGAWKIAGVPRAP